MTAPNETFSEESILAALHAYWGFDSLRPLQAQAIRCGLARQDSLVVMPTGGGKSLCFQVPPLLTGRLTVVVSPLIALMKDQVDGLNLIGYAAGAMHSGQGADEFNQVMSRMNAGELRLLYVAPERLLTPGLLTKLAACDDRRGPWSFAIDEAHCISQWGHDFRPEYRRLAELRTIYPNAAVNGFTATATPRVREDVVKQLGLKDAQVLVGRFDRPNLTYRVVHKVDMHDQIAQTIRRHADGATIVYAISRKATEEIAAYLKRAGIEAEAYHAGLPPHERRRVQDAFSQEQMNVVVATVAFGMGIDRGNVRCVIHAELPKSIEQYQQETGRSGRDGLPSECVLLYSAGDAVKWNQIIEGSASENGTAQHIVQQQLAFIEEVRRFATNARCRHQFLSEYFGQAYEPTEGSEGAGAGGVPSDSTNQCNGCDVCLGELDALPDSTVIAQKIISCVARLAQANPSVEFGANHIIHILRGSRSKQIVERGHNTLSTYGILSNLGQLQLASCINQLMDMGYLKRAPGTYPTISLTPTSWQVLRGRVQVALASPKEPVQTQDAPDEPFDTGCFEMLRALRLKFAHEKGVAAYIIFADKSLQDMARARPVTVEHFGMIHGVGNQKLVDFGETFSSAIAEYCRQSGLSTNQPFGDERRSAPRPRTGSTAPTGRKAEAYRMFEKGTNIADVAQTLGVVNSTAAGYLTEYIEFAKPQSVAAWIDTATYDAIAAAADKLGATRYRPIFDEFAGQVTYDQIRIVMMHRGVNSK